MMYVRIYLWQSKCARIDNSNEQISVATSLEVLLEACESSRVHDSEAPIADANECAS